MRYMKGVPEATIGSALAQVSVCPQPRVVRPQLWFPHLAAGLASLKGQGIDLTLKVWKEAQPYPQAS